MDTHISDPAIATKLTRTLAAQASAVTYEALPEPVRELARQCVLDYYGVALAGADDPLATILLDELAEAGGAAQASIIGHQAKLPALSAALVNGAIGHALDYADVNLAMPGHPSVAILPGLIALAEQRNSTGREVVAAFVAGYETACRIGMALRPGHYDRGFHATGTIGAFGAAAACAHLLRLDAEATARALRERHGVKPEQIAGMTLSLDKSCERVCNIPAPTDGLEAKFSLRQTVAMTLSGVDTASLAAYSSETATDPALVRLRDKLAL